MGLTVQTCPNCSSDRVRRGGMKTWLVYLLLIALGLTAALAFALNAAIVAGVMIAGVLIAHLVFDERVCLDCGSQWKP